MVQKGYSRTKYKDIQFVKKDEFAQDFIRPFYRNLDDNGEEAEKYAREQSKQLAGIFLNEFSKLDLLMKNKLEELKSYASEHELTKERIRTSEKKIKWFVHIKERVESILEI